MAALLVMRALKNERTRARARTHTHTHTHTLAAIIALFLHLMPLTRCTEMLDMTKILKDFEFERRGRHPEIKEPA